jgi:hypothetical protein
MLLQPRISAGGSILYPTHPPDASSGIELFHLGRQPIDNPNPGSFEQIPDPESADPNVKVSKDPGAAAKVVKLLQMDTLPHVYAIAAYNHHHGHLGWANDGHVRWETDQGRIDNCSIVSSLCPHNLKLEPYQRMIALPIDGLTVRNRRWYGSNPDNACLIFLMRTLDCLAIAGISAGQPFGAHVSSETLCGFYANRDHELKFRRSILKALFGREHGVDPRSVEVWFNPAVSGTADNCQTCFEHTETPGQPDGSLLLTCLRKEYPKTDISDLVRKRPEDGKWDFLFCDIVKRILIEAHGVPEDSIHTEENPCTRCHAKEWHSDRVDRHDQTSIGREFYAKRIGNHTVLAIKMDGK